ncbi:hypothetical protein [Pectobacterium polaris]|uniref:HNH endonuclease n=1 Tax=Pectobacterium polaris TaxID=2042057 RepID=A0AAW5G8Z4_9GAMM|nr:hypothetical protein [Pectobacterium polaris]MCL6349882.1 hypothetical protein [Pectobacterium polaris]MCL6367280.1 hypothetical protein [Pectobacterium polaris]
MRDDTDFLGWCVRSKFFEEFNRPRELNNKLRVAIVSVFFAGDQKNYQEFNNSIADMLKIKKSADKLIKLRLVLHNKQFALVRAAFICSPWKRNGLSAQSASFEKALSNLSVSQKDAFNEWMEKSYTRFRDSVSAPRFAGSLATAVCPYCDKAFLDVSKKFYGELDHYLDKSTYSYYALNIFNFVPVCSVCNKKKSKKKLKHFQPMDETLDSIFQFCLSDRDRVNALSNYQTLNVKIDQRCFTGKSDALEELNKTFSLNDRYENMTAVVDYLAQLKRIYTPDWMKELQSMYGLSFTQTELRQLLLGQFNFRQPSVRLQPLTKLIDDLVRDLDVFSDNPS